jgi:hypothetical protein
MPILEVSVHGQLLFAQLVTRDLSMGDAVSHGGQVSR